MKNPSHWVLITAVCAWANVNAATYYQLTTLDVPFGSPGTTAATGVNNLGEVVGNYAGPDGDYNGPYPHAFQWIGGDYKQITNGTSIWDINDFGLAVGLMPGIADGAGLLHDVHTLDQASFFIPGSYHTRIEGINNAGQVVGNWYDGMGSGAFVGYYTNAALVQFWNHPYVDYRNEGAQPHGIDNLGHIAGYVSAHKVLDPQRPYYVGGFITSDPANPVAFTNYNVGDSITHVTASNTNGVMVGYYSTNGWHCGFIYEAGVTESYMAELPRVISTQIWDVNDQGWLAGNYVQLNEYNQPTTHGFLAVPMAPQPIPLAMQQQGEGQLVFTWYSKAFTLQCGPHLGGSFTNIPGASSPWTNSLSGEGLFFRLIAE